MKHLPLLLMLMVAAPAEVRADPQVTSWFTTYAGRYARIYTSYASQLSGSSVTTWTNGTQSQTLPAYSGVQGIAYSGSWIYIYSTGLGSHVMGPWFSNNVTHTGTFPNYPDNRHTLFRFPRTSTTGSAPGTKTLNGGGTIGLFVDGVAMYNSWDAFSWNGTADAASTGSGGYWNRDAYVNEGATFDPANAHQDQSGTYHYHANPVALRYLLGDHVAYSGTAGTYAEASGSATLHSPILGWVADGYPVYGPYGYSSALDATSGVRRMVSGYQLRNGQNGADTLTTRTTIPAWAQRLYNAGAAQAGPTVSSSYPLGRYMEDNAFLGDLTNPATGKTWVQGAGGYDLDVYNGRYCVTPEYPGGTYAYFVAISSSGTPVFPYNIGRAYYGNPTGGAVSTISESVTTSYSGAASIQETAKSPGVDKTTGDVTLTWSSVEGGSYKVQSSQDLSAWSTLSGSLAAASDMIQTSYVDSGAALHNTRRFYKAQRVGIASYDPVLAEGISSVSPSSGTKGANATLTITLNSSYSPAPPPANVAPNSVTMTMGSTTLTATSFSRNSSTGVVTANYTPISSGAPSGAYTVNVTFLGPAGTMSKSNAFTIP